MTSPVTLSSVQLNILKKHFQPLFVFYYFLMSSVTLLPFPQDTNLFMSSISSIYFVFSVAVLSPDITFNQFFSLRRVTLFPSQSAVVSVLSISYHLLIYSVILFPPSLSDDVFLSLSLSPSACRHAARSFF